MYESAEEGNRPLSRHDIRQAARLLIPGGLSFFSGMSLQTWMRWRLGTVAPVSLAFNTVAGKC
jgi:hypothetical protein